MSSGDRTKAAAKRKQAQREGEEDGGKDNKSDQKGEKRRNSGAAEGDDFEGFKIPKRRKDSDGQGDVDQQKEDSQGSQPTQSDTEQREPQQGNTEEPRQRNGEPKNPPKQEKPVNNNQKHPPNPDKKPNTQPKVEPELKIRRHQSHGVQHSVFHAQGRSLEDIVCRLSELDGTADKGSSAVQRWRLPPPDLLKAATGPGRGAKRQKQDSDQGASAQGGTKRQKTSGSGRGRSSPVVIDDEPQGTTDQKNEQKSVTCPLCAKAFTVGKDWTQEKVDGWLNEHVNKCIEQQEEQLSQDAIRNMTPPPLDVPLYQPPSYPTGMPMAQPPHGQHFGYMPTCINPAPQRSNQTGYDANLPCDLQGTSSPTGDAAWERATRTGPLPRGPQHPTYDPTAYQGYPHNQEYSNSNGYPMQTYGTNGRGRGQTGNRPLLPQPYNYPR